MWIVRCCYVSLSSFQNLDDLTLFMLLLFPLASVVCLICSDWKLFAERAIIRCLIRFLITQSYFVPVGSAITHSAKI